MAVRWLTLKNRVLRVLDDTERSRPTYSDEEVLDWCNSGLIALASSHTAQEYEFVYTTPASTDKLTLPENFISIGPVYYVLHGRRVMLTPVRLAPGESLPSMLTYLAPQPVLWSANSYGNISFYEYPAGTLNFTTPLVENLNLHAAYFGHYAEAEKDTDLLMIPRWAEEAIVWYMQMLAMAKPSNQAALLGPYKTRLDAGTPEDNPLMKSVEYCRKMWDRILASNEKQARTGWEAV